MAQPAVTRHIANLENWIGAPLFIRRGNIVELTESGRVLADLSTAMFDRLELGVREVGRSKEGELVVGASFGVAHLWVIPRIGKMRAASNANINLVTSDDYAAFDDPAVDFSIRFGNGDFGENCADQLFEERCQIIAAPSFLENNPGFDPYDLAKSIAPEMLLDHGDPNGIGWMDWSQWHALSNMPFPGKQSLTEVQSYPTMLDMVFAGEGISIGTIGIEDDLVASGKLVRIGSPIAREGYGYYLVFRKEQLQNASFEKLRMFLSNEKTDSEQRANNS